MSEIRQVTVQERGCGYPHPGGLYLMSEGTEDGALPSLVVLNPGVPHHHVRVPIYINGARVIDAGQVVAEGASLATAEEYRLRQKLAPIIQLLFGPGASVRTGQAVKFYDALQRLIAGKDESAALAALKAQASIFAPYVVIQKGRRNKQSNM